jgi:hypothetical protein
MRLGARDADCDAHLPFPAVQPQRRCLTAHGQPLGRVRVDGAKDLCAPGLRVPRIHGKGCGVPLSPHLSLRCHYIWHLRRQEDLSEACIIVTAALGSAQIPQNTMTQEAALMNGLLTKFTCRITWDQLCPVLGRLLEPVPDVLLSDKLSNMTKRRTSGSGTSSARCSSACLSQRCTKLTSTSVATGPSSLQWISCQGCLGPAARRYCHQNFPCMCT